MHWVPGVQQGASGAPASADAPLKPSPSRQGVRRTALPLNVLSQAGLTEPRLLQAVLRALRLPSPALSQGQPFRM